MIIAVLVIFGLCLGSFVNALTWRLHEQEKKNIKKEFHNKLSIINGRSMCPNCRHKLAAYDLIPVLSWLILRGKCRYCSQSISIQYPAIELLMGFLFVASYFWWPLVLSGSQIVIFILWLLLLIGFAALLIYDLRWYILPNRILYPLAFIASIQAIINITLANKPLILILNYVFSVIVGGGIFYVIFQISGGKWIGGGDVKLGLLLGLVAGTAGRSILFIFLASVLGSLVSIPLLVSKRLKPNSRIPFGPFLITSVIIVQLFGSNILNWYQQTFFRF
jgi:prepilin signal peptidase PulO-like enzyme (type II secretory pathway)